METHILDFNKQAQQMLTILEERLRIGNRDGALQFLSLKFKSLYEQGVINGKWYEREGRYPYNSSGLEE